MSAIAYAGTYVGTVITMPGSGLLTTMYGWESVFYVFGSFGCVWFVLYLLIIRESPEKDKYISDDELRFIEESLGPNKLSSLDIMVHPWKEIFKSPAVWAICAAHFSENWGFYTLLTQLPTFLKGKQNVKEKKNAK